MKRFKYFVEASQEAGVLRNVVKTLASSGAKNLDSGEPDENIARSVSNNKLNRPPQTPERKAEDEKNKSAYRGVINTFTKKNTDDEDTPSS